MMVNRDKVIALSIAALEGFEPPTCAFKAHRSANWAIGLNSKFVYLAPLHLRSFRRYSQEWRFSTSAVHSITQLFLIIKGEFLSPPASVMLLLLPVKMTAPNNRACFTVNNFCYFPASFKWRTHILWLWYLKAIFYLLCLVFHFRPLIIWAAQALCAYLVAFHFFALAFTSLFPAISIAEAQMSVKGHF